MAGLSDHEITYITLSKKIKIKKEYVTKRWLKSPGYDSIALLLSGEDWTPMETMSADNAAVYLETKIIKVLDEVAPVMKKEISVKKINQWSTSGTTYKYKNVVYVVPGEPELLRKLSI